MATKTSIKPMVKKWDEDHTYSDGEYWYHTESQIKKQMQKKAVDWLLKTPWKSLEEGAYWYCSATRKTKSSYGSFGIMRAYRYRDNGIDMIDCVFNGKSKAVPTIKAKEILRK